MTFEIFLYRVFFPVFFLENILSAIYIIPGKDKRQHSKGGVTVHGL